MPYEDETFGWRVGELLPIKKKYKEVAGRMEDTGDWDWAVPTSISGIPEQINTLGSAEPTSDEAIGAMLNLSGFGTSPIRGTSLTARPAVTSAATTQPKGVLSELSTRTEPITPKNAHLPSVETLASDRWAQMPEGGWFLGPWATQEQFPGISLATKPQANIVKSLHGTSAPVSFDTPGVPMTGQGWRDEALHTTTDPTLARQYSHAESFDPFEHGAGEFYDRAAPRTYPVLTNLGGNPVNIGELQWGLYPWRSGHGFGDDWSGLAQNQDFMDMRLNPASNKAYVESLLARNAGESFPEHMENKGYTSMVYGHEPMRGQYKPHQSIAVTDPNAVLSEFSHEGLLAKKWNEVRELDPDQITPEIQEYNDFARVPWDATPEEARKAFKRFGYSDADADRLSQSFIQQNTTSPMSSTERTLDHLEEAFDNATDPGILRDLQQQIDHYTQKLWRERGS